MSSNRYVVNKSLLSWQMLGKAHTDAYCSLRHMATRYARQCCSADGRIRIFKIFQRASNCISTQNYAMMNSHTAQKPSRNIKINLCAAMPHRLYCLSLLVESLLSANIYNAQHFYHCIESYFSFKWSIINSPFVMIKKLKKNDLRLVGV